MSDQVLATTIEGLDKLRESGAECPAIFYVAQLEPSVPPGSLGITDRPDVLLHLVIDGLERSRWSAIDEASEQTGAAEP